MDKKRTCGGCTSCCFTHGVTEIKKQPRKDCSHCTSDGCGIYKDRPEACQKFRCAWLMGIGEDIERPDLIGAVSTLHPIDVGETRFVVLYFIIHQNSTSNPEVLKQVIEESVKDGVIVVISNESNANNPLIFINKKVFDSQKQYQRFIKKLFKALEKI